MKKYIYAKFLLKGKILAEVKFNEDLINNNDSLWKAMLLYLKEHHSGYNVPDKEHCILRTGLIIDTSEGKIMFKAFNKGLRVYSMFWMTKLIESEF